MRSVLAFITLVLVAGPASALTYYGEVYTSDLAGNLRAEFQADIDFNPFDLSIYNTNVSSPGLGSASIPPAKTISFSVDPALGSIEKAWLYIGLTDDMSPFLDPFDPMGRLTEVAVVEFGSTVWTDEVDSLDWLLMPLVGNVTAELLVDRTNFVVNISSDPQVNGDFKIVAAALKVRLGDVVGVVPEPNAALLFGIGALVVASVRRR